MSSLPEELKITVDATKLYLEKAATDHKKSDSAIFCPCKTELCTCDSKLSVTEATAKQTYAHLGYPSGRVEMLLEGYRLDTIHIWGTQDLSTADLMNWLNDFGPKQIEWIDDFSCNVVLIDENSALRAITKLSEPFDRRTAVAAITAVATVVAEKAAFDSAGDIGGFFSNAHSSHPSESEEPLENGDRTSLTASSSFGSLTTLSQLTRHMPSNGRWFKAFATPQRAFCLYLRFAHKGDVKLPGAERRSDYYKRFGNPNYGGIVGLLSHSYRRRTKTARRKEGCYDIWTGDLRRVNSLDDKPSFIRTGDKLSCPIGSDRESRKLVTYNDLYDDSFADDADDLEDLVKDFDEGLISIQSEISSPTSKNKNFLTKDRRRGADGLEFSPNLPRKWPREDAFPLQDRPVADRLGFRTAPEAARPARPKESLSSKPRSVVTGFNRVSAKKRLGSRLANPPLSPLATITLLPDIDNGNSENLTMTGPHRLLASLSMVADLEEQKIFSQKESNFHSSRKSEDNPFIVPKRRSQLSCNNRNVWNRLG